MQKILPYLITLLVSINAMAQVTEEQGLREEKYDIHTTVGEILDLIGREKAQDYIQTMTANSNKKDFYENSQENILNYWFSIALFAAVSALLSVIFLEFVDKDKR